MKLHPKEIYFSCMIQWISISYGQSINGASGIDTNGMDSEGHNASPGGFITSSCEEDKKHCITNKIMLNKIMLIKP